MQIIEELTELMQSGAPEEVLKAFINGYWAQVDLLHIIVGSTIAFICLLVAVIAIYGLHTSK